MKLPAYTLIPAVLVFLMTACTLKPQNTSHGILPADFASIHATGELSQRIQRNFDRLEEEYYHPENVFWSEKESGGWPGDKEGRTILALTLNAQASGRTPKYLDTLIKMLPAHLNAKGYLGTIHEGADEQQLSGHGWLLRGLCEYYRYTGDEKALSYAKTIADSLFLPVTPIIKDYPCLPEDRLAEVGDMSGSAQNTVNGWRLSSDVGCVFIGMEGLIHYYSFDRDPRIKETIDSLVNLFLGIDLVGIKAQTHASLTAVRGLLRYAEITGNDTLITEAAGRWQTYRDYGMTENYENYNWFSRYGTWTEPCAIIDSYMAAVQLWAATRNAQYLDDAEKIYLNGMASTQRSNGGFGCDKPLGVEYLDLSVHADEAYWCCTMRGGEGLPRAAQYSYFTAGDTIFVPFYRENTFHTGSTALSQHTQYPFGDTVTFTVGKSGGALKTLSLRIPPYMHEPVITVNGKEIHAEIIKGFANITRTFSPGDTIKLQYSFRPSWEPLQNKDITDTSLHKAVYGPLVLGTASGQALNTKGLPAIERIDDTYDFIIANTCDTLRPLYHLMDPAVSLKNKYRRAVVAKNNGL